MADVRGSVIAVTNASGTVTAKNTYDTYGTPAINNIGRFQYTGQMWMAELKLYHFKARAYHPALGRFLQTDPIGYGDGLNLYQYAGGDPVNARDPSGLCSKENPEACSDQVIVQGTRCLSCLSGMALDDFFRSLNQFLGEEFLKSFGVGPSGESGGGGSEEKSGDSSRCNQTALAFGNASRSLAYYGQKVGGALVLVGFLGKSFQIGAVGAALATASTALDLVGAGAQGYGTGQWQGAVQATMAAAADYGTSKALERFLPGVGTVRDAVTGGQTALSGPPEPTQCPG